MSASRLNWREMLTAAAPPLAAFMASMINSPVVSESAAKMPPLWNQRTPWPKISFQLKSPGLSNAPASLLRL